MQTRLGTAGRLGVMFLVALVAAVAWIKPLEAPASETLDAAMKKAFITFATARALNGGISLLQSGQVSVQAVGGVSFNPGEVLDPINDLVEQFSNVMLAATVALGIQKVLLAMGMHWVLPVLVTAVAAVWIAFCAFGRGSPRWITQLLVLLLMVRFATLKRQVIALERQVRNAGAAPQGPAESKRIRFIPKGLVSTRKRLGLSAADLAKMMGVSAQTIYNWERGVTKSGRDQLAKLASLRGVGKRQLRAHFAAGQAEEWLRRRW